jgi:hypothetical protein
MDWLKPYMVSRVRVAALRAAVEAGMDVEPWQLRRALEPVLGDLLPLPEEELPSSAARAKARQRSLELAAEADRRHALGTSSGPWEAGGTVDKDDVMEGRPG